MKLLYANDQPGQHAPSWYADTCSTTSRQALLGNHNAAVCVVGAGFTGLATALELAKAGTSVIVLDAHRVGWGASGRNGGQLGSGFNQDQQSLETTLGKETARKLWHFSQEAKAWVHKLCLQHNVDIDYQPGIVTACHRARWVKSLHQYCQYLEKHYHYSDIQPLNRQQLAQHVNSENYYGGAIDSGAGHIHPLKLATGMALAAEHYGAKIYEMSGVLRIVEHPITREQRVVTSDGSVLCETVVIATNGYSDDLDAHINTRVMPINNFIVVSEPLGALAECLLPHNDAIADSRFVVNYFRRVGGDRLLFGGGENYSYQFPKAIDQVVRTAMVNIFPCLAEVKIDYAWGGTLAITRSRMPYLHQLKNRRYYAGGYSGHGVALAGFYGACMAQHILGNANQFDVLSRLPMPTFPGGKTTRSALLAAAMTGYSWLDKL